MASLKFSLILFGLNLLLRIQAWRYPSFRERLRERDILAQLKDPATDGRAAGTRSGTAAFPRAPACVTMPTWR